MFCVFPLCVLDNWALVHAQQLAVKENLPLHVCVCLLVPKSELSTLRHYSFMLKGLEEVAKVMTSWLEIPVVQYTEKCIYYNAFIPNLAGFVSPNSKLLSTLI